MGFHKEDKAGLPLNAPGSIPPDTLKAALELWSQAGEAHFIPVRGVSMLPLLRDGDLLLVSHHQDPMQVGEIAVFQSAEGLIAHRVLRVSSDDEGCKLLTKGDNRLGLDPEIDEKELVGRAQALRRGERQMRLDTRAWQWAGRMIAGVMRGEARLHHKLTGRQSSPRRARYINALLSRSFRLVNYLLIGGVQVLIGRWES